jgi:hypothetical protein
MTKMLSHFVMPSLKEKQGFSDRKSSPPPARTVIHMAACVRLRGSGEE